VAGENGLQGAGGGCRHDGRRCGFQVGDQCCDDTVFTEHAVHEQFPGRQVGGGRIQRRLFGVGVRQQLLVQPRRQLAPVSPHLPQDAGVGGGDQPGDMTGQGGGELAVVAYDGLRGLLVGDGVGL
jgi:hypothetical protein